MNRIKEGPGKLIWLCPPLMTAFAVWIFTLLGFTIWAAVFKALLLVCPAIIILALVKMTRSKAGFSRAEKVGSCGIFLGFWKVYK